MTVLVLATSNPDKAREIAEILAVPGLELRPRPPEAPDVVEDGATLEENALKKARALCQWTGLAAVADDTGLFVEALQGRPGIFAARYAGDNATYADNVAKLLDELKDVPSQGRSAVFVTVAAATYPDGREIAVRGELEGSIVATPRGSRGFGYDPVFEPAGSARTLAEMSLEEKNIDSHRTRAFRQLAVVLGAKLP
jgi:XTP/dITP diphosphohydrolase